MLVCCCPDRRCEVLRTHTMRVPVLRRPGEKAASAPLPKRPRRVHRGPRLDPWLCKPRNGSFAPPTLPLRFVSLSTNQSQLCLSEADSNCAHRLKEPRMPASQFIQRNAYDSNQNVERDRGLASAGCFFPLELLPGKQRRGRKAAGGPHSKVWAAETNHSRLPLPGNFHLLQNPDL